MDIKNLTAPCGLDCFNCQLYEKNITEEIKNKMANIFKKNNEDIPCKGCRNQDGYKLFIKECATLKCIKTHNVEFCFECKEYPCDYYIPCKDGAERYPHNFKLYNLGRIKLIGLDNWAKESLIIRQKYYNGKFVPGSGPVLNKK